MKVKFVQLRGYPTAHYRWDMRHFLSLPRLLLHDLSGDGTVHHC